MKEEVSCTIMLTIQYDSPGVVIMAMGISMEGGRDERVHARTSVALCQKVGTVTGSHIRSRHHSVVDVIFDIIVAVAVAVIRAAEEKTIIYKALCLTLPLFI